MSLRIWIVVDYCVHPFTDAVPLFKNIDYSPVELSPETNRDSIASYVSDIITCGSDVVLARPGLEFHCDAHQPGLRDKYQKL